MFSVIKCAQYLETLYTRLPKSWQFIRPRSIANKARTKLYATYLLLLYLEYISCYVESCNKDEIFLERQKSFSRFTHLQRKSFTHF